MFVMCADCRPSCTNVLIMKSPLVTVHSESFWQATVTWRPRSPLRLHAGQCSWMVSIVNVSDSTEKFFFS